MATMSKKQKAQAETVDRNRLYGVDEAIALVRENASSKFDETVEVAINLGVDPRHADQMVRGVVQLPKGTGKTVRVGVFARGPKAEEATAAGADVVGADVAEVLNTSSAQVYALVRRGDLPARLRAGGDLPGEGGRRGDLHP